jgi:hypothetical protein
MRNKFIDPKTGNDYSWEINHSEEEETGQERSVEDGANTANTGLLPQQADDQPLIFRYTGTIFSKAQIEEMIGWFRLCKTQTIRFEDFAGEEYEVLITSFKAQRRRTVKNPRDFANAPLWYWKYTIEMRVITILDSVWEGVVT